MVSVREIVEKFTDSAKESAVIQFSDGSVIQVLGSDYTLHDFALDRITQIDHIKTRYGCIIVISVEEGGVMKWHKD